MRVFLTGGTGLVGSHVAEELRAHGHEVVALHRRAASTKHLYDLGCDLVEGDVRDEADDMTALMEGCSRVVHSAAVVYAGGRWPKIRAINVDGTRHVLTAARHAGVEHVVHMSSVAVYGSVSGPVTESTPIDTPLTPKDLYARSKREAEEVVRGIEGQHGLPVTIIRPSAIYGERDRLLAPAIANILRLPLVPILGQGSNALPVVYAGNVAVATRLALEAARGLATFNVGMDHPITQRELFELVAEGMGKNIRIVSIPEGAVRVGADILSTVGMSTPGAKHLPLRRVVALALGENPFRSERIRDELGWDPPYQHAEALARTGEWLLNRT
jgi:nucleoside-diphosphate-sugar epimerase